MGCGHAQEPNPFANLSAPSADDLSVYEGHTLSTPGQKSRAVPHHPTLAALLKVQGLPSNCSQLSIISPPHFPSQPTDLFTTPTCDWLIITTIVHSGTVADVHMRYVVLF